MSDYEGKYFLGNIDVLETSSDEMKQHQPDTHLLRERDEYEHQMNSPEKQFTDDPDFLIGCFFYCSFVASDAACVIIP